ncbi:MAG: hypothetical protein BAJALOKI1v1_1240011 [Promethearchaeota archaeon]|nr:MAG: hypothetical protein BAJALOKI1v1_1240011 [Candidatus Lokiarchaeota archaeon]
MSFGVLLYFDAVEIFLTSLLVMIERKDAYFLLFLPFHMR